MAAFSVSVLMEEAARSGRRPHAIPLMIMGQFSSVCWMEGSLVRLDAACRDSGTPRVCGNLVLFKQMEAASNLIKRDVIFASSLYVSA